MGVEITSIEFKNLTLLYGAMPIFDDVNFSFPLDGLCRIDGGRGSGTSTLLQILIGTRIANGHYLINGEDIYKYTFEEFQKYRILMGYGFDLGGLLSNKSLKENILLPIYYHGGFDGYEAEKRYSDLTKIMGITKFVNERPAHVSGGIRKLACLCRAFVTGPQVLLLDQPTIGLSDDVTAALEETIRYSLRSGKTKAIFYTGGSGRFLAKDPKNIILIEKKKLKLMNDSEKRIAI